MVLGSLGRWAGDGRRRDNDGSGSRPSAWERDDERQAGLSGADLLVDGRGGAAGRIVLAHGAGAPMDSPFMQHVARVLAAQGFEVVRFEFPYMRERRRSGARKAPDREPVLRERFRAVLAGLGGAGQCVIGGKSLGGRIASLVADELELKARGLVCLGYPFHPPGKPEQLRTRHLESLATPALIVQGTRDPFGRPDEVAGYKLSLSLRVHWLEDGDHSFKTPARSARRAEDNLDEAARVVAGFARGLWA